MRSMKNIYKQSSISVFFFLLIICWTLLRTYMKYYRISSFWMEFQFQHIFRFRADLFIIVSKRQQNIFALKKYNVNDIEA